MNMNDLAEEIECVFYFIIKGDEKTKALKVERQKKICDACTNLVGVSNYSMRSGRDTRSSKVLQEEFKDILPKLIEIIYVIPEENRAVLLSQPQRNSFIERIIKSTEEEDTALIAEKVMEDIVAEDEFVSV